MSWTRFQENFLHLPDLGFSLDISRMDFPGPFLTDLEPRLQTAYEAMARLEAGAIANPDEDRMVGHYWLRDSQRAPTADIRQEIEKTFAAIQAFTDRVHRAEIKGASGPFTDLLVIGIGGSALGPQFVAEALGRPGEDRLRVHFFDNTDPDGIDKVLAHLRGRLGQVLAIVISKSGGTPETRNGMLEAAQAFLSEGVDFPRQAVAVTGVGSKLDKTAQSEGWLARFPMWDWVGGRTSELAAVGLLPAALQGLDIQGMLRGAREMDAHTRSRDTRRNPAALLAAMWLHATNGRGEKDMVILPYKDRLALFSKYLQQLIMESLGKEKDLQGRVVHQGIAVYGNKGSTDQHAYVQQLREGVNNFFATFIEVLKDREGASIEVEPGTTSGDFLSSFFLGTRAALHENGRQSLTLTITEVNARTVGMLIALYERAVGLYATLVGINAYHQPGVEAGKKAAARFLDLQHRVVKFLSGKPGAAHTAEEIARGLGEPNEAETVFKILQHLAANGAKGIQRTGGGSLFEDKFSAKA